MPEKIMRVKWDDGAALTTSRKAPGDYSALTRDVDTKELGQVTLSDIDECELRSSPAYIFVNQEVEERDETAEAVAALITLGVIIAVEKAAPHVKQWLKDTAVPAMKASRARLSRVAQRGRRSKDMQIAVVVEPAMTEPSNEVVTMVDTPTVTMTSAEWQERFRLMLLAGAFKEEQWRLLSTARVEDGDDLLEVQSAMKALSPQQVADGMRLALEANQPVLDAEMSAAMSKIFTGIRVEYGEHALPAVEQPD